MTHRIPPRTEAFQRSLDSKAWKQPEIVVSPVAQPRRATPGAPYNMPLGNPYQIQLTFYTGEREFVESHYIILQNGITPTNDFMDMFMRYWWDEEYGSPEEDDGYAYADDLWVSDTFNYLEIPRHIMQELITLGESRPHVYGSEIYNTWRDGQAQYNNHHGYED